MADVTARERNVKRRKRPEPRGSKRRGRMFAGVLGHMALFLLTIVIAAAATAGVVYVRISHGPISLKFLAATIEKGINAELSGFEARIDDALLALTPDNRLELQLANLRLSEPDGDIVATVPTAAVELSRKALWALKVVPSRIDLIEPRLFLFYSDDSGLALSFVRPGQDAPAAPMRATAGAKPRRVELSAMISEATQRARKQLDASSYLNQIGVRDAIVTLDNLGVRSQWRVIDGAIKLDHRKRRSIAEGHATIASDRGPWTISAHTEDSEKTQNLTLRAGIKGLVPRTLGLAVPQLSLLETLDVPVTGQATLDMTSDGAISTGELLINLGRGQFQFPAVADVPFDLDSGELALTYDGAAKRFALKPSTLVWGDSHVSIAGGAALEASGDAKAGWLFDIATSGGQLAATEFGVAPLAIEKGIFKGRIAPATGEVRIDQLSFKAGGAELSGDGVFLAGAGPAGGGANFQAKIGPAQADTLKVLWPKTLAKGARNWVGQRIKKGTLKGGTLRFVSGAFAKDAGVPASSRQQRLTLAMEASDITAMPLRWLPAVEAPRALIHLEDDAIEITVPDASVVLAANRKVPVKGGRFYAAGLDAPTPIAEITYRAQTALVPVLEILDLSPLRLLKSNGMTTEGLDGKVDAQMKLTLPLIADVDSKDVKIEAKAKVSDGRAKQLAGAYDVQSGAVAIDVTDASVTATGDMLVNGVPVKLGWQRILEENGERQPPLRLSAILDNADRTQLGIDINHILQGEVPVEVLVEKGNGEGPSVRFRADLTNAEIALESIAWHKPPGKAATLQAEVHKGKTHKFELQNLRVAGDDIAIEGTASIGADNKLREVTLPGFSLNVITRLDIAAVFKDGTGADKNGVWQVKVKGQNFDGRDLFRSLFSVGPVSDKAVKATGKPGAGMDVDADIDNVIGHSEVSLRGLKLKMSRRADKMTFLDARGTLDGGGPVAVVMNPQPGEPRLLRADTTDAGQAFKLIGFYPNMQTGRARLEVNVDGRGPAEKTGTLWVEEFRVLGDPIVSEVLGSATAPGEAGKPVRSAKGKGPQREVFEFDLVKVPFAVGCGQFVMENASLRGPLLGVTMVGKADFKQRTLNLGGTYIPLQGLNNAFGAVPGVGALASGPQNDGAFGITFAVQGSMAQPQVLVNPLSIIAPGIFRELFQMTNPNPKVSACDDKAPVLPVEKRVRATPPAAVEAERAKGPVAPRKPAATGEAIDGWSTDATTAKQQKK